MKKLKKKLNYFIKVFLVISLLFSNLSSLSVVFADEGDELNISVTDNNILVSYLGEVEDTDDVTLTITENYTYLDETLETTLSYDESGLTGADLTSVGGVTVTSQMLSNVKFNGLYELKVEVYDINTESLLDANTYSENITFPEGLTFKIFDGDDNELTGSDNAYTLPGDVVKFKATIGAGKLLPNDVYVYNDVEYLGSELLELSIEETKDYTDLIYGEYELPISVSLLHGEKEITYDYLFTIQHGSYGDNATVLNGGTSDEYQFTSTSKDGTMDVYATEEMSISDIVNQVYAFNNEGKVSVKFSNSQYEDIEAAFYEYLVENPEGTEEEFLDSIKLDNSFTISITSEELTITYTTNVVGDVNGDGSLDDTDLEALINQAVGLEEVTTSNDLDGNGEVDIEDAAILNYAINNKTWEIPDRDVHGSLEANLLVKSDEINSGDEFDVDYVISLDEYKMNGFSGLIDYDHDYLELVGITPNEKFSGTNNDEKYLYISQEYLTGLEVIDDTTEEEITTYESVDYVVLTLKFKALKSGTVDIAIVNNKYIDDTHVFETNEDVNTEVVINASDDNTLATLNVAGSDITLEDGVLDYKVTVSSDTTSTDVLATLSNVAAEITSIVAPEELVEGDNEFSITVTAENGDVKVYTIVVTKEAPAPLVVVDENIVDNNNDNVVNEEKVVLDDPIDDDIEEPVEPEKENGLSKIIVIALILLVIAGLIYLIFKDDDNDDETKKANKEINKLKKNDEFPEMKKSEPKKVENNKSNNVKTNNNKNTQHKNNKKGR